MTNIIKVKKQTIYVTPNRSHYSSISAENEIIEQNIRDNMTNSLNFNPRELAMVFIFIFNNREIIKKALNMEIKYE